MNKLLSGQFNNRVEGTRFEDDSTLDIDCIAIEDEYGNSPQRAEQDCLIYNKPLEYVLLILNGDPKV